MKTVPLVISLILVPTGFAAELKMQVRDQSGNPVARAVVFVAPGEPAANPPGPGIIDQINKRFVPEVSAVRVGTAINFPNKDAIRHHVYSFSPPRIFELELYSGEPAAPVSFDKPGLVTMGCNIHDSMLAYLYVVDSPHFALTDEHGIAVLDGLPRGPQHIGTWHYRMTGEPGPAHQLVTLGERAIVVESVIELNAESPQPPPLEDY